MTEPVAAGARRILPDNEYEAVCFGMPTPQADVGLTNRRTGRLADPVIQQGARALARDYPNARIVLAQVRV